MYQNEVKIRVRYAETDQMGYVYYGNYAMYYEVARVESFRNLGFIYRKLEEQGVMMPDIESKSKYLSAAKYDDLLTIKVSIPDLPSVKILFHYSITNENGDLINEGETLLAFVDMKTGMPCRPPQELIGLIKPFYES